jgi:drug/metabolite transporter (DMT)-like permease
VRPRSSTLLGVVLVLISAISFGGMAIFARFAYAAGADVLTVLTLRFLIAAAVLWPAAGLGLVARGRRPFAPGRSRRRLVGLGFLGLLYVGQAFGYFAALQFIPASTTALILYTYPALVALLARLFLGDRLDARRVTALLAAPAGLALILGTPAAGLDPRGVVLAAANALIYSVYIVSGARITAGLPPLLASAVIMTVAAGVYMTATLVAGRAAALALAPPAWPPVLGVALVSTVVAVTTFFLGLERLGAARTAIVSTFEPVVTVALAAVLLGEALAPVQYLGGALVLAAVLLLAAQPGRKAKGT